jgi:hypothetical protein
MRLPVHIWIREENATPEELAGYFTEIARRLDAHPQKMRLMIESSVPAALDFDPADGEPVVSVGGRTHKFSLRHRWLPEHPVPLLLGSVPNVLPASAGSVPAFSGSVPISAGSVPIAQSGSVPDFAGSVPIASSGSVPKDEGLFFRFFGRIFTKNCVVLLIDPIEGNRFRVRSRRVLRVPRSLYALFALVAVAAVVTLHPLALTLSALLLIGLIVISLHS